MSRPQAGPDLLDMLAELDRPEYSGAPLGWTVDLWAVEEFAAAEAEYIRLHTGFGIAFGYPHIWRPEVLTSTSATPGHEMTAMRAHLGCNDPHRFEGEWPERRCYCFGGTVHRALCACGWASPIVAREGQLVASWHDHAWPGWRDLPLVPLSIRARDDQFRPTKEFKAWLAENYPAGWLDQAGAPLVTEREAMGSRSVPGYSPSGGFDVSMQDRDGAA